MKPFFEKILKNLSSKSKYIEEKKSRNNSSQKQLLHKKKKEKVAPKFKRVRTAKKLDLVLSYNLKQNGKFLIQQKDFKKALQELNTSIEHNNSDYEAFELRGIVKENLKDIEGAIKDFEQAIIWSDKKYQAKLNIELALLKFRNGANEESIFDLSKITKLYKNKYRLHALYERGWIYLKTGKEQLAIDDFEKFIDFCASGKFEPLINNRCDLEKVCRKTAELHKKNQNYEKSIFYLEQLSDSNFGCHYNNEIDYELVNLNEIIGKYNRSIEYISRLINRNPFNKKYFAKRKFLRKKVKDIDSYKDNKIFRLLKNLPSNQKVDYQNLKLVKTLNKIIDIYPMNKSFLEIREKFYQNCKYFEYGINKLFSANYQDAIYYLTEYIELDPYNPVAYSSRGDAKYLLKNYQDAVKDFSKVIELNPNNPTGYISRGEVKIDLENYKGAAEDFSKAIELDPNINIDRETIKYLSSAIELDLINEKVYYWRGRAKQSLENFQGAIQDFSKVIELDPNNSVAYLDRGRAKKSLENFQGAIEDFSKVIELDPNNAGVYRDRGAAAMVLGNYQGAMDDFSRVIELDPNNAEAFKTRGAAKYLFNNYQGAMDDFSRVIELDPNDAGAHIGIGKVKIDLGNYQGAMDDFSKVIELNPTDKDFSGTAYFYQGKVAQLEGNYEEAFVNLSKSIELIPDHAESYFLRGYMKIVKENDNKLNKGCKACNFSGTISYKSRPKNKYICPYCDEKKEPTNKDYKDAIEDLSRSIEFGLDDVEANYWRGYARLKLKSCLDGAITDFSQVINSSPNDKDSYKFRGCAKILLENYNDAIEDLTKASKLQPDDKSILKLLSSVYAELSKNH